MKIPNSSAQPLKEAMDKCEKLEDVKFEEIKYPIGSWAGKFGEMVRNFHCHGWIYYFLYFFLFTNFKNSQTVDLMLDTFDALKPLLQPALEVTNSEYEALKLQFKEEANQNKTYQNVYRVYARKV